MAYIPGGILLVISHICLTNPHNNIEEENGNPLQYSCLENSTDGGAWWATVNGVAKSQIQLSDFTHSLTLYLVL